MTRKQLQEALHLAKTANLSHVDYSILDGCALRGYQKTMVTMEQVARLFQDFLYLDGSGFDMESVNVIFKATKNTVIVIAAGFSWGD